MLMENNRYLFSLFRREFLITAGTIFCSVILLLLWLDLKIWFLERQELILLAAIIGYTTCLGIGVEKSHRLVNWLPNIFIAYLCVILVSFYTIFLFGVLQTNFISNLEIFFVLITAITGVFALHTRPSQSRGYAREMQPQIY